MTRVPVGPARGEEGVFLAGLAEGGILFQLCEDCGAAVWYLRTVCPACGESRLRLERSGGSGTVHTMTTLYRAGHPDRAEEVPYTVALVDLDEGVRVIGDLDPGAAIGSRVSATVLPDGVVFAAAEPAR